MRYLLTMALFASWVACAETERAVDPAPSELLPGWTDTLLRTRILHFVDRVSDPEHPSFVPPEERIAVFDMDGTLVIERPIHLEVLVAMAALRDAAGKDPALASVEPYRAVLEDDVDYIRGHGADIVTTAAGGLGLQQFHEAARAYLADQTHPTLARPYAALFYQPMLELVALLRERGFRVYVVSQTQQEYIRAFALACLGLEPSFVIGSTYGFAWDDESQSFIRSSDVWEPYNRGVGKVLRIRERVGALPILAVGNSTSDRYVMEATARAHDNLVLLVDHDDPHREFEYHSEAMLELARERGWAVVSMRKDFAALYGTTCTMGGN